MMLYQWHELSRNWMAPWIHQAEANAKLFSDPNSWLSTLPGADRISAGNELVHRLGKDYEKPPWNIHQVEVNGAKIPVVEQEIIATPFCRLLRFKRYTDEAKSIAAMKKEPAVLVVAPLSGHHATLLRDTVRTLLQDHKVYVTEWIDARLVPAEEGGFGLDDYVATIEDFIRHIGADNLHVISVCQPTVPVLMGGPIEARHSPTQVNDLATKNPLSWFKNNVIHTVPAAYPGQGRSVYPGFLQHAGFIAMNPSRHFMSHWDFYADLVKGDLEDADSHRRFYDEYNAVLDMPAEYYLDTIRTVFQEFLLPRGKWKIKGELVNPAAIKKTALLSIEGELDDISGLGQTAAAHDLCTGIPKAKHQHITVKGAGHYGIFSGRRWREVVYPDVRDFISKYAV
jgi:poly(3-hydroxybutyrate) depolymerase